MKRIRNVVGMAALAVVSSCAVNPATGERELMLVSENQEIAMGREADPEITAAYGLVDDPELQRYVSELGQELAAVSERPDLPWSFKVVDDPIVNAFALPGGFIYVTRGILARFDSEAELAGVLGHEIGHVTARHSASQMSRQQLQQIGLVAGAVLSETVREYAGLASASLQLLNLKYSRDDESQSDRLGLRYIDELGYDADAMIGVFEMLGQASGGEGGRLPEWQSTHPYPETRASDMRDIIAETGASRSGTVDRDVYLNMLDGLMYGPNPREGYFEGGRFLHPDLRFQVAFPAGWSTVNQRSVVAAISPNEDAILALSVVPDGVAPEQELRDFLRGEGISGGAVSQSESQGVVTAQADFRATNPDGTIAGTAAFLQYDGTTYRLLGYGPEAAASQYGGAFASTIRSFGPVTDPAVLNVEPMRLRIVRLGGATSLTSYVRDNPQPIEVETLAELNRVAPGEVLSSGRQIKTVVGEPVGR